MISTALNRVKPATLSVRSCVLLLQLLFSISTQVCAQNRVDLLSSEPVLVYEASHEMLAESDNLKIEIYSDGHATLHYPDYMVNAGDYQVQLSPGEFQRLINTLDTPAIQSFNKKALGLQKKEQDQASETITFVSDASYSSFEISRNDENGNKNQQNIKWPRLHHDAKKYPGIVAINKLAEVESVLLDLINRAHAQKSNDE